VALPFWLDRPDQEAIETALAAEQAGIEAVWVGEWRHSTRSRSPPRSA
jgi:alkanesulfonate monooxygenase SsuD/methylene tetrahydromethanopterin reductase-like flavin-dependent oxidoreductase (luciferase family)